MSQPPPYDPNTTSPPSYPAPDAGGYGNAPAYSGQPGGYGSAPAYGGPGAVPQKNQLALVSMILGIAGLVLIWLPYISILGIIAGIVGLVLGIIALRKAPVAGGKGQAIAGVVCSAITIAIFIVALIAVGSIIAANS